MSIFWQIPMIVLLDLNVHFNHKMEKPRKHSILLLTRIRSQHRQPAIAVIYCLTMELVLNQDHQYLLLKSSVTRQIVSTNALRNSLHRVTPRNICSNFPKMHSRKLKQLLNLMLFIPLILVCLQQLSPLFKTKYSCSCMFYGNISSLKRRASISLKRPSMDMEQQGITFLSLNYPINVIALYHLQLKSH